MSNAGGQASRYFAYGRVQRQSVPKLTGVYVIPEGLVGVLGGNLEEIK